MVTGQSVRARNWVDGPPANLSALPGSKALGGSSQIALDGQPTQCAIYRAPKHGVESVLRHYRKLAEAQTSADTPYLEAVQPGGATLVWVDSALQRRGVIIQEDVRGGTRYQLLWAAPPAETGDPRPALPLGMQAPAGCDVVSSALGASGGTCLLAASGDPYTVARRFVAPLRSAGFQLDTELPENAQRVAFSFRSPTHAGLLVAAAGGGNRVRVSLSVEPAVRLGR